MSSVNTLVMNASLFKNLPYDPVTDFAPISLTAWGSLVLVADPAQTPNTLAELVTAAKANPRKLTYGSPGVGTPHHLSMALVEQAQRHRAAACALQGHGRRGAGPAGRPDRLHVPAGPCLGPVHPAPAS